MAHYESKILSLGIMNEDNDMHNTIQSLDISIRTSYERDRKRAAATIEFPDNFSFQPDDAWISSSFLLKITTSYRDLDGDYDEAEESFVAKDCQMEKR